MATPTVTLAAIIKQLNLNINYVPDDPEKLIIHKKDVTRPGLPLAGFYDNPSTFKKMSGRHNAIGRFLP